VADSDYQATSGTLTFNPGEVSQPVAVLVNGDTNMEPNETFFVNLSNATNATIADGQGVGTIENDDFVPPTQVIRPDPLAQTVSSGDPVSITVTYSTANPIDETLTGLGLRIHYDSSKLTWDSFSDVFAYGKIDQDTGPFDDTSNFDGDPATDKYLTIAWDDLIGRWPGEGTTHLDLYTVNFTASASFINGSTAVNFSASSTAAGYSLDAQSATVDAVGPSQLRVDSLEVMPSGFIVHFNRQVDPDVLNLYDKEAGIYGSADFTVVGNTVGPVAGSLICNEDGTIVSFIKTGGPLEPDTYLVTLRSADNGFKDSEGHLLDGDADDVEGGDYMTTITVEPTTARLMSIPDFARGPGQDVNVPAMDSGIPVTISDDSGILAVDFVFDYDPALLTVTGVSLASGLPNGWTHVYNLNTPGHVAIAVYGLTPLDAGQARLAEIKANIPDDAAYTSAAILSLSNIQIDEGAIPSRADSAVQVAAYFGDATGNHTYSGLDAAYIARVAVGLDGGFAAYRLKDPVIVTDVTGNGWLSGLDAAYLARKAVGLEQPEIPDLPDPLPGIIAGGRDPLLSIPENLTAQRESAVTVPILVDDAHFFSSIGFDWVCIGFELALFSGTAKMTFLL
jgi:hypothetical protein